MLFHHKAGCTYILLINYFPTKKDAECVQLRQSTSILEDHDVGPHPLQVPGEARRGKDISDIARDLPLSYHVQQHQAHRLENSSRINGTGEPNHDQPTKHIQYGLRVRDSPLNAHRSHSMCPH